jgi:hypothetical protein
MARPRFLRRDADQPRPLAVRRPAPGVLRRERRGLERMREQRLRDLGGLLLEMFRRGSFREELLSEQAADLVAIETRLAEIDAALTAPRRRAPRCECGVPLLPGARFCPSCGRPVGRPAPAPVAVPAADGTGEETMIEPPPVEKAG